MKQIGTAATLYRGGTSKALFVRRADLPFPVGHHALASWIRAAYGSPDRRQIDGIGGADLTTSKFVVVGPPTRDDADVDYSFFQVGIDNAIIATDLNCGNISAAVVPFAVDAGLLELADGQSTVTIHNTNDGKLFYATVEVTDGVVQLGGDFENEGVPGTGFPIALDFRDSVGGRTGELLPTGSVRDTFTVDGLGEVDCTVVDIANLIVFAPASAFGLTGTEDPATIANDAKLLRHVELLRGAVATKLGFAASPEDAATSSPGTPFVSLVAPAATWAAFGTGQIRHADECDLLARGFTMGLVHKAYWGTGSICTGVAAVLPGSVVHEVTNHRAADSGRVRIGHPSGVVEVQVDVNPTTLAVTRGALLRTARKIMDGTVYVPADKIAESLPVAV
ncbi:PrpF domain-containing protein [soil metagenome]